MITHDFCTTLQYRIGLFNDGGQSPHARPGLSPRVKPDEVGRNPWTTSPKKRPPRLRGGKA